MKIPTHIIGYNHTDLDRARAKYLTNTGGSTMGCKFLTLNEARDEGLTLPMNCEPFDDMQLTELAEQKNRSELEALFQVFQKMVTNQFKYGMDYDQVQGYWEDFHDRQKSELR